MLVEQLQDVVDDCVLGSGKAVLGMLARGYLRRNSVRYVVAVLLVAETLLFKHFYDRGDLPPMEVKGFRGLSGRY